MLHVSRHRAIFVARQKGSNIQKLSDGKSPPLVPICLSCETKLGGWEPYKAISVLSKARLLALEVFPPLKQVCFFLDKVIFKGSEYYDFSGTGQ